METCILPEGPVAQLKSVLTYFIQQQVAEGVGVWVTHAREGYMQKKCGHKIEGNDLNGDPLTDLIVYIIVIVIVLLIFVLAITAS